MYVGALGPLYAPPFPPPPLRLNNTSHAHAHAHMLQPGADYINANHIAAYPPSAHSGGMVPAGHRGGGEGGVGGVGGALWSPRFIASQGPVSTTVADFWRMVWQSRAHVIAMTTQEFGQCAACVAGFSVKKLAPCLTTSTPSDMRSTPLHSLSTSLSRPLSLDLTHTHTHACAPFAHRERAVQVPAVHPR